MEFLFSLDQQLFLFFNHLPHVAVTNLVARALSGAGEAGIIWLAAALILFLKEERKDHWFFVSFLGALGVSFVAVEACKTLIVRARPTIEMGAILVGKPEHGFSFPSGHATLAFAGAAVLATKEPKLKWVFYILASAIAFSRIYLGVHYPIDVLAGALLGWGIGTLTQLVTRRFHRG